MRKFLLLTFLLMCVTSCRSVSSVSGVINSEFSEMPPDKATFLLAIDQLSITDRKVGKLIEQKMLNQGFIKAVEGTQADIGVLFKYGVGSGITEVSSSYNYGTGQTYVDSDTHYQRFFHIAIVDMKKSRPNKIAVLWSAELTSKGRSDDILSLAPHFLDALFDDFGKTVNNKKFKKQFQRH